MINKIERESGCGMMHKVAGPTAAVVADGTIQYTKENPNKTGCSERAELVLHVCCSS